MESLESHRILPPCKHVFVCTNTREPGKSCCAHVGGEELFYALKDYVRSHGLAGKVWVTRTGCLGFCNDIGASVVVYPQQRWFLQTKKDDLSLLIGFISNE